MFPTLSLLLSSRLVLERELLLTPAVDCMLSSFKTTGPDETVVTLTPATGAVGATPGSLDTSDAAVCKIIEYPLNLSPSQTFGDVFLWVHVRRFQSPPVWSIRVYLTSQFPNATL